MDVGEGIRAYYDKGNESARLSAGAGRLEFMRTQEIIERFIPERPLDVLDVGGGPGRYASWLADNGHRVEVVDPIPLHVEQAQAAGLASELGDARELQRPDDSVDVVLLLGPLYHLPVESDRRSAVSEALRVLRPQGLIFAAAIARFAALLDLLVNLEKLHEPGVFPMVEESIRTGAFRGPGEAGLFTTSYFHRPDELRQEISASGFEDVRVFHVEGPGALAPHLDERLDDPRWRETLLDALRLIEEDETMTASSHLLAVARKPSV